MWIKMEVFDELKRIKGLKGTEQVQAGAKVLSRALRSDSGLDLVDRVLQLVPKLRPGHDDFAFVMNRLKARRTSRGGRRRREGHYNYWMACCTHARVPAYLPGC